MNAVILVQSFREIFKETNTGAPPISNCVEMIEDDAGKSLIEGEGCCSCSIEGRNSSRVILSPRRKSKISRGGSRHKVRRGTWERILWVDVDKARYSDRLSKVQSVKSGSESARQ